LSRFKPEAGHRLGSLPRDNSPRRGKPPRARTTVQRRAMLRKLWRMGLFGLLAIAVALGCNKQVVQQKQPPDPLVHSSKKPVTPGYHVEPEQHTRTYPAPPAMPGSEPVHTTGVSTATVRPVRLEQPIEVDR
jgi:hypothetical protein